MTLRTEEGGPKCKRGQAGRSVVRHLLDEKLLRKAELKTGLNMN